MSAPPLRPRQLLAMAAVLLLPAVAYAQPRVGDAYEIVRVSDSTEHSSGGLSGSSHDKDTIVERVIAVGETGLELEYDFPASATAQERASNWQLPVRVLKPPRLPILLRNRSELESRVDTWLKAGGLTRAACGRWYFTWNAFRIECDPESVIRMVAAFDLRTDDLRDGAPYKDPMARASAPLRRKPAGSAGDVVFTVEMPVDPDVVLRERAEADVIVAELSGKILTLDSALRARAAERISGTITITFDADTAGNVRRRKKVTKLETKREDGQTDTRTTVETLERRPVSRRDSSSI
jgi:hypothetical protein